MINLTPHQKISQTKEDFHSQTYPVLELLALRKYAEARTLADFMVKNQVPPERITRTVWDYVTNLIRENHDEARTLTAHFKDIPYLWHCWPPKQQAQLTLKNQKPTHNYG